MCKTCKILVISWEEVQCLEVIKSAIYASRIHWHWITHCLAVNSIPRTTSNHMSHQHCNLVVVPQWQPSCPLSSACLLERSPSKISKKRVPPKLMTATMRIHNKCEVRYSPIDLPESLGRHFWRNMGNTKNYIISSSGKYHTICCCF